MNLLRNALFVAGVGLLSLGTPSVAEARPRVALKVGKTIVQGRTVAITGDATGLPNGVLLKVTIGFKGTRGLEQFGEVKGNAFEVNFGDGKKKLLPGTYSVLVKFDPKVQRRSMAEKLKGIQVLGGKGSFTVGTPEKEKAERAEIRNKYEFYLGMMNGLNSSMDMFGSSLITRAAMEKLKGRGKVAPKLQRPVIKEWGRFSELFDDQMPTIRFDLKAFRGLLIVSYFPDVDELLLELCETLDRKHAGLTRAIYDNLGAPIPEVIAQKEQYSLAAIKRSLPNLAEKAYKALGVEPVNWKPIDGETVEKIEDAHGDVFKSTVSKFEISKPTGNQWVFDTGAMNPHMRIRIRNKHKDLTRKLVSGVELRDYPLAENNKDLALLDENATRGRWPGFELIEAKRLEVGDRTMPNGKRPGQELRYTFTSGSASFQVIQYSLFCRWHKRTYTVMSFAEKSIYPEWEETFEKINMTFKILDAPKLQERLKKEEERMKKKREAAERKAREKALEDQKNKGE